MRSIILAFGLCAFGLCAVATAGAEPAPSIADVYARYPAPIGHRQPSVHDVEQARSAREAGVSLNEIARQIEGDLRSRLTICRGC